MQRDALALSVDALVLSVNALVLLIDALVLSVDALVLLIDALALPNLIRYELIKFNKMLYLVSTIKTSLTDY
ncbi:hypothetical protein [Nostoc sp.]|uniref:hypothetical protein n=1 Tax=Nostoc sp. TaxID=1180 RepID=UPI002FF9EFB7